MDSTFGETYGASVSVLVADAHANRRGALRVALLANSALRVIGQASDVEELVVELEARQPRVLVVSDDLLDQCADLAHMHLQSLDSVVRTLVVTASPLAESPSPPLRAHLWGRLTYSDIDQHLVKAVLAISQGEMWFSRCELSAMVRERAGRAVVTELEHLILQGLTSREIEIVHWVMRGKTNKQIGHELSISDLTVKTHVQNIFKKCGLRRRGELPGEIMAA